MFWRWVFWGLEKAKREESCVLVKKMKWRRDACFCSFFFLKLFSFPLVLTDKTV